MNQEFGLVPNTEMIREYVVPVLLRNNQTIERIMFSLKGCGVSVAACVSSVVMSLLKENELKKAVGLGECIVIPSLLKFSFLLFTIFFFCPQLKIITLCTRITSCTDRSLKASYIPKMSTRL